MKNTVIKIAMAGSLIATTMSLSACSSEELALGAGVIIGVIIADDGPHERPDRYPDRGHRHDRRRHYDMMAMDLTTTQSDTATEQDYTAANHLNLSVEQAQIVMTALRSAQNQDFSKLAELGITEADLNQMAVGENPSVTALKTMSSQLGIELGEAHELIQTLKTDLATGLNR